MSHQNSHAEQKPLSAHYDAIVIGAGQTGLAMGYFLRQQGRDFIILDAGRQVGESWRNRWDSLRLFTPAVTDSLPGLPFPAPGDYCPTKDEMADYLVAYATRFALPVRLQTRVERLTRQERPEGARFLLESGAGDITANQVVVATGPLQAPAIPPFAAELAPTIRQLHSSAYRNPAQLPPGAVLVIGAGNSGAEIAADLAKTGCRVILSGRDPGHVPGGQWGCRGARHLPGAGLVGKLVWRTLWWLLTRTLTADTCIGRKIMSLRPGRTSSPLIRLRMSDLLALGIERAPRTVGIVDGRPQLADGQVLDVAAVIWATGFRANFDWIELPIFDSEGYPLHHRGVATGQPGLYFLGLPFQHTILSEMIAGEVFDAAYIAEQLAARSRPRVYGSGYDKNGGIKDESRA